MNHYVGSLEEHPALLSLEPSLQPLCFETMGPEAAVCGVGTDIQLQ